jgi:hypothetical protein
MRIVTPTDWENSPMSEQRQSLALTRTFSAPEFALLRRGLLPQDMDDKWFIYCQNNVLHFHRSWTGHEIYQLGFDTSDPASVTTSHCWVTRDPAHYTGTDAAEDAAILGYLIDRLLLNRDIAFPSPAALPPQEAAVLRHNIVGNSRSNHP